MEFIGQRSELLKKQFSTQCQAMDEFLNSLDEYLYEYRHKKQVTWSDLADLGYIVGRLEDANSFLISVQENTNA